MAPKNLFAQLIGNGIFSRREMMMVAKERASVRSLITCTILSKIKALIHHKGLAGLILEKRTKGAGNLMNLRVGLMSTVKTASNRLLLVLAIAAITACGKGEVTVEITDLDAREKYIEVLKDQGLPYHMDDDGLIYVEATPGELEEKMQPYEDWRKKTLQDRGVVFMK